MEATTMTTIKADCSFIFFLSSAVYLSGEGFWKHADFYSNPELATSWLCDLVT